LHLGEHLEKQGHPGEAAAIYVLAESAEHNTHSPETHKKLADHLAAIPEGNSAMKSILDPRGSLQSQRTFKVARPANLPETWGTISFEVSPDGSMDNVALTPGESSNKTALERAAAALKGFKLKLPMPAEAKAPLLREGVLSCHSGPTCDFVLITPTAVLDEN